jgi:hypothetical protein
MDEGAERARRTAWAGAELRALAGEIARLRRRLAAGEAPDDLRPLAERLEMLLGNAPGPLLAEPGWTDLADELAHFAAELDAAHRETRRELESRRTGPRAVAAYRRAEPEPE